MPIPTSYKVMELRSCSECDNSERVNHRLYCRRGEPSVISLLRDKDNVNKRADELLDPTAVADTGTCDEFVPLDQ